MTSKRKVLPYGCSIYAVKRSSAVETCNRINKASCIGIVLLCAFGVVVVKVF